MFETLGNIFQKTIRSKAFWAGILLCLTFCVVNPAPASAGAVDCPSMATLRERYQGNCFPCQIVNVLLGSFMRAAGKAYDVSREAGTKLLFLGTILWLAFWALKKMSSMTNVEPSAMSNELVVFFGKIVVAYCFINAGVATLVNYAVNPILGAGADMGTALLLESQNMEMNKAPKSENAYTGPTEIVDKNTMNKILKLSEGVSNEVAMNLVIGNALTCYSIKKGLDLSIPGIIEIHIPDIWLWLVGAAIWCIGFMLVLSVCYYLIDIPFKIGFSIIALPVVIGLWPFKITSGKLKDTIAVSLNAAGTFLFLALSASYAMRLISQSFANVGNITDQSGRALSGAEALLQAMYTDNAEYVENVFSFTGGSFLIIMFCYIYGFQMISKFTNELPGKFFGEGIAAGGSPLHHMATAATMWATNKAAAPFKAAANIVAHQAGKAATTVAKAGINVAGGAVGAASGSVVKFAGRKTQKFGQKMAEKARQDLGQKTTTAGKFGAALKLGLANTVAKTGEYAEKGGKYMSAPGERTLSRVQDAWKTGTQEIAAAGKEFVQSATASGEYSAQSMKSQASREFKASLAGLRRSGRKLATYIPKSGFPAPEGTLRNKLASLNKAKLKTVFSGQTIKAGVNAARNSIRQSLKENFTDPWKTDAADLKNSAGRAWRNITHIAADVAGQGSEALNSAQFSASQMVGFKTMKKDVAGALGELKKSAADFAGSVVAEHGLNHAKGTSIPNQVATAASVLGTAAATKVATGSLGAAGVGTIAGRHLYNNLKEAFQETAYAYTDAYKNKKINNAFDVVGAIGMPVMMIPRVLTKTASQTIDSSYEIAEKAMLAGIDVALTATSPLKVVAKDAILLTNIVGQGARVAATAPMAVVGSALDVGEVALKGVRQLTRPIATAVVGTALAPLDFTAKVVDETLYHAYKMTVRPAATLGTAALRATHSLGKGIELGVKNTKLGRGTIRTFTAGGKTLKVGVKTLKLGRDLIRAAAGEGGKLKEELTPEELAQRRAERRQRRQEAERRERQRREEEERRRQQQEHELEEYHAHYEREAAQRQAEEDAARATSEQEAAQREAAAEAQAQANAEAEAQARSQAVDDQAALDEARGEQNPHQALDDAIANEEIDGVKNYNNEDLQRILNYQDQLINGTNNSTAFESLHENSVSDMQKFANGTLNITQDSYATMGRFIQTFGTGSDGKLTEVGRAAQTKLTSLIMGSSGGGSSGGGTSGGNRTN